MYGSGPAQGVSRSRSSRVTVMASRTNTLPGSVLYSCTVSACSVQRPVRGLRIGIWRRLTLNTPQAPCGLPKLTVLRSLPPNT